MIAILIIILSLFGCGAKTEDTPITYKITISQSDIRHQTLINDIGTQNRTTITISIFNTQDGKDNPANGSVKVTYGESNLIKIYDPSGAFVPSGNSFNINATGQITIQYDSRARPTPLDYTANITFTYGTSVTVKVVVIKPENATYTLKALPDSITGLSAIADTGTWRTVNVSLFLTAKDLPIQDNLFVFCNNENVRLTDIRGKNINQSDIDTDINGRALILASYYTKEGLSYNTSIQVFYGNTSVSIPIKVDAEQIIIPIINTTINPNEMNYKAGPDDTGTWRTANFIVNTKTDKGLPISTDVALSVTSEYMKVLGGRTATVKTNSNGILILDVQYYTQSKNSMIEYIGYLLVNNLIVKFDIKATQPTQNKIITTVVPTDISYTTQAGDAGTWRTQGIIITTKDSLGNPTSASVLINSASSYVKVNGQLTTTITTNTNGTATADVNYYTETGIKYLGYVSINDTIFKVTVN